MNSLWHTLVLTQTWFDINLFWDRLVLAQTRLNTDWFWQRLHLAQTYLTQTCVGTDSLWRRLVLTQIRVDTNSLWQSHFHTDSFWLWLVLTQTRFGRDLFWQTRFDTDSLWHRLVLTQTRFDTDALWHRLVLAQTRFGTDLFWHRVVLAPRRKAIRILEWHRHLPPLVTFISDFSCRVSYRVYYIFFPPKHKFLSQEEYVIQGSEETSRALEDLREYCNSPECNTWKVVSRLKHPTRYDDARLDFKIHLVVACLVSCLEWRY